MFRFTIRDVLWLTALVAIGAGWWLEFKQRGPENMKLREKNERLTTANENLRREEMYVRRRWKESEREHWASEESWRKQEKTWHELIDTIVKDRLTDSAIIPTSRP